MADNTDNLDIADMRRSVDQLNAYIYAYYMTGEQLVSDSQYDRLYEELVLLEKEIGVVLDDSPTKRVGIGPSRNFESHDHLSRLYSLDKVNSFDELREWAYKTAKRLGTNPQLTLEYKIDGLTLNLTYVDGKLQKAVTRGNGITGETVTNQVRAMRLVPQQIAYKGVIEAQGEGYMLLSDLTAYNKTAKIPIKNARNGVAGAIRNLDPQAVIDRKVDIFFYNINYIQDQNIDSQVKASTLLKSNNFDTLDCQVFDDLERLIETIQGVDRERLDFLIDGMVIKVNDYAQRQVLGFTDKFPRWAVAYKFEAIEVSTVIKDIVWQVGRTGKLTPMALLQPVDIGGATVSRATLNNIDDITRKGVGLGSTVFVRRSNDVIPEILYGLQDVNTKPVLLPTTCPVCGVALIKDGVNIFCKNEKCPKIVCGKLEHFVSRECMDIEGVSQKTIETLYNKNVLRQPVQLYALTASDFEGLDGFGDKKIDNILTSIAKSKKTSLNKFVNGLGINGVGKKTANDLAQHFGSIDKLAMASMAQLLALDEIGDIIAQNITSYFEDDQNKAQLQLFKKYGIDPRVTSKVDGVLSGKKFVITGTLTSPRQHFVEIILQNGGTVAESVSKNIDYLLAGDNAGSKLTKAQNLNIKVLTQTQFEALIDT